jgi:hypothetical protein
MKRKLFCLLTLLLTVCSGAWADEELTLTPDSKETADSYFLPADGTVITAVGGTNAGSCTYSSGSKITLQGSKIATITFTIGDGVTITSFKVNGTSNSKVIYALDGSAVSFGTAKTGLSKSGSMSFVLTCNDGTNNSNRNSTITSIQLTYTTGSGGGSTYSVTYYGNGNTSGEVPTDENEYSSDDEVTVLGNTGSLAKTYFDFDGWNTASNGSGTSYDAGDIFSITADTKLYAQWTLSSDVAIVTQPVSADYTVGATPAALTVEALTRTGNYTYQWYKNTTNAATIDAELAIEGATSATLAAGNISTSAAGTAYYYCRVGDGSGNYLTSNIATITVSSLYPDNNYLLLNGSSNNSISASQIGGTGATWSCNTSKYSYQSTTCTFYGQAFSKGLKHESSTWTQVVTTGTGTLTIVQSLNTNPNGTLLLEDTNDSKTKAEISTWTDYTEVSYSGTHTGGGKTYKDVRVMKVHNLPAGTYKIYRGGGITGDNDQTYVVYMGVTYGSTSKVAITTEASPAAGGEITGGGSFVSGAKTELKATPNSGYSFNKWQKDGEDFEGNTVNPIEITVSAAATYTAVFDAVPTYAVTASVADGQSSYGEVSGGGEIIEGDDATVTANPEAAYKFQHWIIDNDTENPVTTNPYTFENVTEIHTAVAYFVARKTISYTVTESQKGTRTDVFGAEYADNDDNFTAPANKYLSSANQTLTGWNDGSKTTAVGGTIDCSDGNKTLTPVFADNAEDTFAETLDGSLADFEVTWDFSDSYGNFELQGNTGYLVNQATINTKSVDMPIAINTTTGKLNNKNRADQWAQINTGTTLTVPVVNGSVVTIKSYKDFTATTINGSTEYEKSGTDGNRIATYTYSGSTGTIDIVAGEGSGAISDIQYISYINVTYPSTFSPAPAISAGTFSFENKAYPVTITGETGTTKIETSVDGGANWTDQELTDLACTVNVTAGQTLLARATVGSKDPSAEVSYTNNFDSGKSYVGWVYGKYSDYASYNPESDGIYASLKGVYNMVPVSYTSADATPSNDLKNADLLVFSEALKGAGGDVMPNKLKAFVGYVPIINMKVFNYTYNESASSNRWGWATGESNPKTADITPNSNQYKILDGVTFSGNKINFYSGASGNQVQTINGWQAEPTNNVALGIGSDSKVAMHAIIDNAHLDKQFFGIGLSCDNRDKYTENAKILIKNVATVLIAGTERLDAVMASVSGTINTTGWNSFSSSYPLDLNTISGGEAYYAESVDGTDVVVKPATGVVPAGEGLMIKGSVDATFTISVADTDGTAIDGNKLVGMPSGGSVAKSTTGSYNYVYGWKTADPENTFGFYYLNSDDATLGAGKAYLHLTEAISEGRLSIIFDDEETTAISEVRGLKADVRGEFYDLSGRKVAQPTKGLYIVNGRKVVIK